MTWSIKRKLLASTLLIAVLLTCFGLGVLPINLFFVKSTISEAVREQLGADLDIQGPLRLRLGFNSSLSASAVSLSMPGSADQPLITIEKLRVRPQLLALLRGDVFLQRRGVRARFRLLPTAFSPARGCGHTDGIREQPRTHVRCRAVIPSGNPPAMPASGTPSRFTPRPNGFARVCRAERTAQPGGRRPRRRKNGVVGLGRKPE